MPRPAQSNVALNLKLPADSVRLGKDLAARHGTTVSALVAELFGAMARLETEPLRLHPLLEQLAGSLADPGEGRREAVLAALQQKRQGVGR